MSRIHLKTSTDHHLKTSAISEPQSNHDRSEEYLFNFMSNTSVSSTEPTRIPLNDTFTSTDSVNIADPIVQSAIRRNTLMDAPEERRNQAATDRSTGSLYDYDYGHEDESPQTGGFAGESEERLSESHNNIALSSASLNAIARNEFMPNAGFKRASMGASQDIIPQHQSRNNNVHLASKLGQMSTPSSRNKVSFSQGMDYQEMTRCLWRFWQKKIVDLS
ncbi:hypothetical protein BJ741DRAFT_46057 [Chytriomyces cf. hyalinus JEL632]|nr:hypothetical protein BJ741DRAFT_46057 [Chytriomyces cf. hyalinus JEL632]